MRVRGPLAGPTDGQAGWASSSLERSLHGALVQGLALWQVVMIAAVLLAPEAAPHRVPLVAAHVAVILMALATNAGRLPLWPLAAALDVLLLLDWAAAESVNGVLALAGAWTCNLGQFLPSMLMHGRQARVFSAAIGLAVPVGLAIVHPDWLWPLAIPALVTGLAMRKAGRTAVPYLRAFAQRVDDELDAGWRERRAVAVSRAASVEAAEQARTLHDTVINTLGAVASGGGATRDVGLVRQRCERDSHTVVALIDGGQVPFEPRLDRLAEELGLVLRRGGLEGEELARAAARLPSDVLGALAGAAREAMRNVAKHAGTGEVDVVVTEDGDTLSVVVADRGPGFEGRLVPGRGLAESVFARAEAAGIAVDLVTAPGSGTEVRFGCPLLPDAEPEDPADSTATQEDFMDVVVAIRHRAGWLWTAGVVAVGVVIETVNRFGILSPTYGMLVVVALAGAVAWWDVRQSGRLRAGSLALVVASVPVAFLLALAGTGFGRGDVILWQCIGVTAPLVVLLVQGRGPAPLAAGVVALVAASAAATVVVARESPEVAMVIPIGTAPALGLMAGWFRFHRALELVGGSAARQQRDAAAARLERAARDATATARERWRQAGLHGSLALLRGLASGALDPADPRTRAACAEEEAYLRQVSLLDPELFRLGYWLARALAQARAHGVRLVARTGGHDVEDAATAAALGALLDDAVAAAPHGSELTVSLFATGGSLRFGLVGPAPVVVPAANRWDAPHGWRSSVQDHGGIGVVEAVAA